MKLRQTMKLTEVLGVIAAMQGLFLVIALGLGEWRIVAWLAANNIGGLLLGALVSFWVFGKRVR